MDQHFVFQAGDGFPHQAYPERSHLLLQGDMHVGGRNDVNAERHLGMAAVELLQCAVKEHRLDAAGHEDADMARDFLPNLPYQHAEPAYGAVDFHHFAVDHLARFRHHEAARAPVDEAASQALFQSLECQAYGGLRQQETAGGGCDAAFLHDDHEGTKQVPVQLVAELFQFALVRPFRVISS